MSSPQPALGHFSPPPTFVCSVLHTNPTAFFICLAHNFHYLQMPFTLGISYPEALQSSNALLLSNSCLAYPARNKTECLQHHTYTSYDTGTFSLVFDVLPYCRETPENSIQIPVTSASRVPGHSWPTTSTQTRVRELKGDTKH